MSKTKTARKLSALLIAFVLAFSLAGVALAADINVTTTFDLITKPNANQFGYFLAPNNSQALSVCGTNDFVTLSPMTFAQASGITWSTPFGNGGGAISITSNTTSSASLPIGSDTYHGYFANTVVTASNSATPGTYVVRATYSGTGATFDYAVTVQSTTAVGTKAVTAYVVDATQSDVIVNGVSATVAAPNDNNYPTYNYTTYANGLVTGQSQVLQNDPSAMGVLDSLLKTTALSSVTLQSSGGYVSNINGIPSSSPTGFEGWTYAVYDGSGNLVNVSQWVGAGSFILTGTSGYTIVWKYTDSFSFASTLTAEIASW